MLTVYTAIYGGRDKLHPPLFKAAGVRFVCFTDDPENRVRGVDVRVDAPPVACPARAARWHKTHPPKGDTLWMDGVFQLVGDPRPALETIDSAATLALERHPKQICIYHEAIQCAVRKKDDPKKILRQAMHYIDDGFPSAAGMWMGGLIYRRANCSRDWQDLWWDEIENHSSRDQISLPFALWKTGQSVADLPALKPDAVVQHTHEKRLRPTKWFSPRKILEQVGFTPLKRARLKGSNTNGAARK